MAREGKGNSGTQFGRCFHMKKWIYLWRFPARKMGVYTHSCLVFVWENPIARNGWWLGVPPFLETREESSLPRMITRGCRDIRCFPDYKFPIVDILQPARQLCLVWLPGNIPVKNRFLRFTAMNCGNLGSTWEYSSSISVSQKIVKTCTNNQPSLFSGFGDHLNKRIKSWMSVVSSTK